MIEMLFLTFASFAAAADLHRFAESMGHFTPIALFLVVLYFLVRRQLSTSSAETNPTFNWRGNTLQVSGAFDYNGQPLHFATTWERVRP